MGNLGSFGLSVVGSLFHWLWSVIQLVIRWHISPAAKDTQSTPKWVWNYYYYYITSIITCNLFMEYRIKAGIVEGDEPQDYNHFTTQSSLPCL